MAQNQRLRCLYVIWGFVECVLFGGLLFGWPSFVFILKEDGVYSDLCDGNSEPSTTTPRSDGLEDEGHLNKQNLNCSAQDSRLALVFTIASAATSVGCAILGHLNFQYGTRFTRLAASVLFIAGALFTAFTSYDLPWLIFPGLSLLGIGGVPLLMTNTQFSMLFKRGGSTIVSFLSGALDASAGVAGIIKLLHEKGISLCWSMLVIGFLHCLTFVSTFFFLPEGFISKVYVFHVIWLSILQLRFYVLVGTVNTWLNNIFTSKEDVSHFTDVFQYTLMFGVVISPIAGFVYDINKSCFDGSHSWLRHTLMPAVIPQAMTTLLAMILTVLVLVSDRSVIYVAFVINVFFRSFMYSMGAAYLGAMFPSEYFGILYGLMTVLSGTIGMTQYGLFAWSEASGFTVVNGFLVALLALSLIHQVYQWISCRRAEARASMS